MELRLLCGRRGCGKTARIMEDIRLAQGRRLLIVPQYMTHQAELRLAREMGGGFMGAEVLSMSRLAHRVLLEQGGLALPLIDAGGKALIISRVLVDLSRSMELLGRAARFPGSAPLFGDLLAELKRCDITPDMLLYAANNGLSGRTAARVRDIAAVMHAYTGEMEGRFQDAEDAAQEMLKRMADCSLIKGASVYIDGFASITPQIRRALAIILREAKCLTVSLLLGEGEDGDIFTVNARYAAVLRELAAELGAPVHEERFGEAMSYAPGALRALERGAFLPAPELWHGDVNPIRLISCRDMEEQAVAVARDIARRVREDGLRYSDFAVLLSPKANEALSMARAFKREGIPFFMDNKRLALHQPLAELCRAALKCAGDSFPQEAVLRCARTALAGLTLDEADRFENHVLWRGTRGRGFFMPIKHVAKGENADVLERLRQKLITPLLNLSRRAREGSTALEHATYLYAYLTEVDAFEQALSEEHAFEGMEAQFVRADQERRQVAELIVDLVDQVAATIGDERMDISQFAAALDAGLFSRALSVIPTTMDQVLVGGAERVSHNHSRVAYVLNFTDDEWAPADDAALLSEDERRQLASAGIELIGEEQFRRNEARACVYRSLTCAGDSLTILYPRSIDGREQRPHIALAGIKAALPNLREQAYAPDENELIQTPGGAWALALSREGAVWDEVRRLFEGMPAWSERLKAVQRGAFEPVPTGGLNYSSVSRLETYARCPFTYFAAYSLGAFEPDRSSTRSAAAIVGSALHDALNGVEAGVARLGGWAAVNEAALATLAEDCARHAAEGANMGTFGERQLTGDIVRLCLRTANELQRQHAASRFIPLGGEIEFGLEGKPAEIGGMRIGGRIDRADVLVTEHGEFLRIVDYKTGSEDESLSRIVTGESLQLPLYLLALARERGAVPAGFLHYRFNDPLAKEGVDEPMRMTGYLLGEPDILEAMDFVSAADGKKPANLPKERKAYLDATGLDALLRFAESAAGKTGERIKAGEFTPRPVRRAGSYACKMCQYRSACRFDPSAMSAKNSPSEERAREIIFESIT